MIFIPLRKALILGGTHDHVRLVELLKGQGYVVLLADYLPAPPAALHVHKHFHVSIVDREAVLDLARMEKVELVVSTSVDPALATMVHVSEELGTPCHVDGRIAAMVTDKSAMKSFLRSAGIPTADFANVANDVAVLDAWNIYPAVVKPVDANSSKGVSKVISSEGTREAFELAKSNSRTGRVVIEEFMEGLELSVDVLVVEGTAHVVMVSENVKSVENKELFTIVAGQRSPVLEDRLREPLREIAQRLATEAGLRNTALLIQCIATKDGPKVIEFTTRLGGGSKHHFIHAVTGVDILAVFLSMIEGNSTDVETALGSMPSPGMQWARMQYLYGYPGELAGFHGFDLAQKAGVIAAYFLYKEPGAKASGMVQSGDRLAALLLKGESADKIQDDLAKALQMISVRDASDRDLLIRE